MHASVILLIGDATSPAQFCIMGEWFRTTPIWLLGLLLFVATALCALAGSALNRFYARRFGSRDKLSETQVGYVVSIVYALLSLLIGFTFQIAVERFELRRQLVLQDANAIEILYLKAQLLDEPHRSRLSELLVRYAQNHLALAQVARDDSNARELLASDDQLLRELWTATIPAFQSVKNIDFSSSFVESASDVVNIDSDRRAARLPPIPATIILVLFLYSLAAAAVLGAVMKSHKSEVAGAVLICLSTLALMLITDINRPVGGTIRESQEPMRQMLRSLQSNPPAAFRTLRPQSP